MIKNIPTPKGKIYAMSDLHGQRHLLEQWLDWVEFDFDNDILLSAGDLIDRGRDSLWCARLIYEPWLEVCHSNHGQMFADALSNNPTYLGDSFIHNGGDWVLPILGEDELTGIARDMGSLPYVLNVRNHAGELFHIMHAELNDGRVTGEQLQDEQYMTEWFTNPKTAHPSEPSILWGREQFGDLYGRQLEKSQIINLLKTRRGGPKSIINLQNETRGHIISGHTVLQRPVTILNQTCIDTGSFLERNWSGVTFMDLDTKLMVRSGKDGVVAGDPIVITADDLQQH